MGQEAGYTCRHDQYWEERAAGARANAGCPRTAFTCAVHLQGQRPWKRWRFATMSPTSSVRPALFERNCQRDGAGTAHQSGRVTSRVAGAARRPNEIGDAHLKQQGRNSEPLSAWSVAQPKGAASRSSTRSAKASPAHISTISNRCRQRQTEPSAPRLTLTLMPIGAMPLRDTKMSPWGASNRSRRPRSHQPCKEGVGTLIA